MKYLKKYNEKINIKTVVSSGILLYNFKKEILLIKSGGPWLSNRERPWGLPKGRIDEGETSLETAKRELKEEVGLDLPENIKLIYLDQNSEIVKDYPGSNNLVKKIIKIYTAEYNKKIKFKSELIKRKYKGKIITFPEISEIGWFTIEKAKKIIRPVQIKFIKKINEKI